MSIGLGRPPGFIFDFDGVVVDSAAIHVHAWNESLELVLGHSLSDELKTRILGHSTHAIAKMIAGNQPALVPRLIDEKRSCLRKLAADVPLISGVRSFMDWLRNEKIPFGIASNSPKAFVTGVLEAIDLSVGVVMGVEDVQRPKPAPDLFLGCAKRLGISVADHRLIWVFEDSLHGIEAVISAGMNPVGISTQHSHGQLVGGGANQVFSNFNQVKELFVT